MKQLKEATSNVGLSPSSRNYSNTQCNRTLTDSLNKSILQVWIKCISKPDADIQLSWCHETVHVRITLQVSCVQSNIGTMLCLNYTVFTSQYFKWIARLSLHRK
jgi:hypothetical protein